MNSDLAYLSAVELAAAIRTKSLSPVEVVRFFLTRVEAENPRINAFVRVLPEHALARAAAAEAAVMRGENIGPLHGVPVAIKDLFDFKAGVPNTFGCRVFAEFVPEESATYVQRLEAAGAIVIGKTNTPEFGHKGITDNMLFGPTSTPFAPGRNAGGSSGGSAAALAAGLVPLAQGSDAGGSIRIPAAWCGVYGYKASYGRVAAAYRPNAFLSHTPFVHAGPMARSVKDAALMLNVMGRFHPRDPLCLPDGGEDFLAAANNKVRGLRIAFSPDLDVFPVESGVAKVVETALDGFRAAGASVERVKLGLKRPQSEWSALWNRQMAVLYAAMGEDFCEAGVDLVRDHRNEVPIEVIELIESGRRMSAVSAKLDDRMRTEFSDALQDVLDDYDALVTPTLACQPVKNAADGRTRGPTRVGGETVDPGIGWCLTYPINWSGNPAASIPAGLDDDGLPVGLQLIGRRHADGTILALSQAFEVTHPWHEIYSRAATGSIRVC